MLKIYNTLSKTKQDFKPIDPAHIKMYVCGPTVYNFAHIGNARPVVVFDLLARLLRRDYPKVTYARNITDIDDKIIEASRETGVDIADITEKYTRIYEEDMAALGAELPDLRPKATDYIDQMIRMVETLVEKGHAYAAEGHVLFDVPSMENYGELSGHTREELIAGARVEVAGYKKDPRDFVLWKPSDEGQPGWDSPWGRGRPGWHLECSCMIEDTLGNTIDIHGGGLDLIFPHHENEIAQSRCAHGGTGLANYWMHNGYLTVDGEKMSKSLGNFITVHGLLDEFPGKGEAIRLCLLSAHYRQPVDFSRDGIAQAIVQLNRWYRLTEGVSASEDDIPDDFLSALRDDLNTPKALMELNKIAKLAVTDDAAKRGLLAAANMFGVLKQDDWFGRNVEGKVGSIFGRVGISAQGEASHTTESIQHLIDERAEAKKNKNFARADQIRNDLSEQGIVLLDHPDGTRWERK